MIVQLKKLETIAKFTSRNVHMRCIQLLCPHLKTHSVTNLTGNEEIITKNKIFKSIHLCDTCGEVLYKEELDEKCSFNNWLYENRE